MNILRRAQRLESEIARRLERAAQRWVQPGGREPLEVAHAIIETVAERLEPAARGRHVFPFNTIRVSIAAGSRETRARFAAVFNSDPTLQHRITTCLRDAGCDPAALDLSIAYVADPAAEWLAPEFHVEFDRIPAVQVPVQQTVPAPQLSLSVVNGTAEKPHYVFALPRVNLGRCVEVRDSANRLVRTNHVAFSEAAGTANETVSRRHAHIEYDDSTRQYRIADDRSARGTSVVRMGKTLSVPAGARGIRLDSRDEILLGDARLRVRIAAD